MLHHSPVPNVNANACAPCGVDVVCAGDPWKMGLAQGIALREKIRAGYGSLGQLESFRARKPRWMPFWLFLWTAERRAAKYLLAALAEAPEAAERLRGIGHGAGLRPSALAMINAIEPILSSMSGCTAPRAQAAGDTGGAARAIDPAQQGAGPPVSPMACSAVAVRSRRSQGGEPLVARNFDYLPQVQPYFVMRSSRPTGGARSLDFTTAPQVGALDGMNEHGLVITYNYAYAVDRPSRPAPPVSVRIAEALAACRTTVEAADHIAARSRTGGALLMLADATGDIASLELSNTRSHLRRPAAGEDAIFHTNGFSSEALRAVQVPANAVYAAGAPAALRGRRLHESSERRDARLATLLGGRGRFGPAELQMLLADHGPDDQPGDYTPCVHGAVWSTAASLQFLPQQRRVRVAYTSPCAAEYASFEV
jgi:hypothetical protein